MHLQKKILDIHNSRVHRFWLSNFDDSLGQIEKTKKNKKIINQLGIEILRILALITTGHLIFRNAQMVCYTFALLRSIPQRELHVSRFTLSSAVLDCSCYKRTAQRDPVEKPSKPRLDATRKRAQASPPLGALKRRSLST
jgi:hypothetical protein